VLLTESPSDDFEFRAIKAGARGCITKEADPQALERALRAVGKGEIWVSQHLATRLIEAVTHDPAVDSSEPNGLTDREWQVLAFVAQGQRNKEIANHLCVSENTVKTHLATIYKKLRVTTRLEAALHFFHDARRNGHPPAPDLKRLGLTHRPTQRSRDS
jgi:DNA-binding NarL/FixJ family response regulator